MKGYYRDPDATEYEFRGGWFHTGDLAVVHLDGYVEVKDRAKDIIISGGENISSLEVERVIYTHPNVLEVAVVPSPHERFGEVPKAFVVLKPGAEVTTNGLYSYCRERLAGFQCPKRIEFVDALPKTSTGKIQKYVLRNSAAACPDSSEIGGRDR
jgi:fatty-acyl-CoA synthase